LSEQVIELEMAQASEYLTAVATRHLSGIATTTEVRFGIPAWGILTVATERQIDLIVLCSHGRTGFARWALGSVAHTLAHESTVPTLILREGDLAGSSTTQPLCALVPLDGSQLAEAALTPAAHLVAALAAPAPGALHLAQVVPLQEAVAEDEHTPLKNEVRARANAYLAQITERLQTTAKDLQLSVTVSVLPDHDVAGALVSLAEHTDEEKEAEGVGGCDLIAISTHGRHGLSRWVMGSVTDRILNTTILPMLI